MWFLYVYLIVGYSGTGYSIDQQITPNLTYDQCKTMKTNIEEIYKENSIEKGERTRMLGLATDYIVECRRMDK